MMRHFADVAWEQRERRQALDVLVDRLLTTTGVARLAAYQGIAEHGDEQTVWRIVDRSAKDDSVRVCLPRLQDEIYKRLREEREKRDRDERDMFEDAGTITLD
jgi:hypothetical protein